MISLAKHSLRFYLITLILSGAASIATLEAIGKDVVKYADPQVLKENLDPRKLDPRELDVGALAAQAKEKVFGDLLPSEKQTARVTRVIDGDTIKVKSASGTKTVRIIGIDTPETKKPGTPVQCFGKPATRKTKQLLSGREVTLVFDVERKDKYGRTLAYVQSAGKDIGARLLKGGYAKTLSIEPNTKEKARYQSIQRQARRSGAGLWNHCE